MKHLAVTGIIAGLFGTLTAMIGYFAGCFIMLDMAQEEPGLFNRVTRILFGENANLVCRPVSEEEES